MLACWTWGEDGGEAPGYKLLGTLDISTPGEVPWMGGVGLARSFPSIPIPSILSFRAGSGFSVGGSTTVRQPDAGADVGTQARQTGTPWDGSQSVPWPPSPAQPLLHRLWEDEHPSIHLSRGELFHGGCRIPRGCSSPFWESLLPPAFLPSQVPAFAFVSLFLAPTWLVKSCAGLQPETQAGPGAAGDFVLVQLFPAKD